MTPEISNIIKDFVMEKPGYKVLQILDYDDDSYVIAATKDLNKIPMYPYFRMYKDDRRVEDFNNSLDLEGFFKKCKETEIYSIKR